MTRLAHAGAPSSRVFRAKVGFRSGNPLGAPSSRVSCPKACLRSGDPLGAPSSPASCPKAGLRSGNPLPSNPQSGLTLVELIITVAIVAILASAAIPVARFQVKRTRERELRRDLWEMRDAIDHYKDAADRGAFITKADSFNYPPDLDSLVNGVDVQGKKVKFLRRIPIDPMTKSAEWGLRSNQDDPDSDSFGGQNVFDVHTKSTDTALNGTKYNTW